jgi:hypothetical protein
MNHGQRQRSLRARIPKGLMNFDHLTTRARPKERSNIWIHGVHDKSGHLSRVQWCHVELGYSVLCCGLLKESLLVRVVRGHKELSVGEGMRTRK